MKTAQGNIDGLEVQGEAAGSRDRGGDGGQEDWGNTGGNEDKGGARRREEPSGAKEMEGWGADRGPEVCDRTRATILGTPHTPRNSLENLPFGQLFCHNMMVAGKHKESIT